MKLLKLRWLLKVLLAMTEFWFIGIPVAGGIGALVYIATNDNCAALFTFAWAAIVYFLIEFTDAKEKSAS